MITPSKLSFLFHLRHSATALAAAALLFATTAWAQTTYYWDSNGATAGFGSTTGTWGASAFWSTDAAGTSATSNASITTSDTVNFGTAALNYANAAATGPSAAQGFLNMNFGAGQTTALTISGGTLNLAANSTITQSSTSANMTISSVLQGSGSALTKTGPGALTLSGNNTFTGNMTLQGNGTLNLAHSNAAGSGTIFLKSTQTSFPTTLGISGGITVANPIQIDSTTGRETITSTGTGNNALTGGITVTGANNTFMAISNEQSSGNFTISGGITAAGGFTGGFALRGSLAGNTGFFNGAVNTPGSFTYFGINGATTWTLNTAGSSYGSFSIQNTGSARLGVNDAIATNAYVTWTSNSTTGALDLNGFNQSVAGLEANYTANTNNTVTNNGTANSTLTLAGLTANRTFAGVIKDGPTNTISLVMNSSGRTQTLNGANTFSGSTTVGNGTLALGNNLALQNSALDTSGSGTITLASGITTPTLGGLIGSKNLSLVITGNYSLVTALTLNPSTGASNTYSGNITNGAAVMTLTKTGSGTQILSGNNTYTGATTISAGTLQFAKTASLYNGTAASWTASNISVGSGATLALNVGGSGEFSTGNVTTILTNLGGLGGSVTNNGLQAGSAIGFDTTNASGSNFTVTDTLANSTGTGGGAIGLTKLGSGALTLTANNTYTGATTIRAGTLEIGSTGLLGGGSYSGNISNSATFLFGSTSNHTLSGVISGSGVLNKNGSGSLVLSGNNTYTGGTQINGGTLKMGGAKALGGNATTVAVATGATLDLNGQSMTTANTYAITLNGTGVSGAGALTNTGAAATYFGTVALAGDSTIQIGANALTLGNSTSANGITGSYNLTVGGGGGTLQVYGNIQTSSVTMNATGTLRLESANSFAGGLTIKSGTVVAKDIGSLGGNGTGIVYLGDTAGSNTAAISLAQASGTTFTNNVIVQAGSSGTASISTFSTYTPIVSGNVTLNKNLTLNNQNNTSANNLTLSGVISGTGGLVATSASASSMVTLSGINTFSGNTSTTAGVLVLANNLALQNSALDTSGSGTITLASGITTPTFGGLIGSKNLSSVITGNYSLVSALTLNPGTGVSNTYSGNITDGAVGMSLSKTGNGTQILSGNNSYTGGTNINAGVLSLNSSGALGTTGTISFGGGQLQFTANNTSDYSSRFSTAASQAYNIDTNSQNVTLATALNSSGGSLSKAGGGTLILTGNNTYTGATTITAGTLEIGSTGRLGGGSYSGNIISSGNFTYSGTNSQTLSGVLSGSGALIKSGTSALVLSGNNTFSGNVTLLGNGTLNLAHSNAAGSGTIFLKSTQASTNTTLGLSGGITVANAIQIDSTTGRENIYGTGTGDNALTGGITITGAGSSFMSIFNNQSSGNLTISGGITGTGGFTGGFALRGSLAGNTGFFNGVVNTPASYLNINGATNWTLNTAGGNYTYLFLNSNGNARLGVNNAIATNAYVFWSSNSTTGALDLSGFNQSVAGLEANYAANGNNTVTNNGASDSTLTLAGLTANRTFAGVIKDGPTNTVSLVMDSSGRTQTLSGVNTYSGNTTLIAGTLALGASNVISDSSNLIINGGTFDISIYSDTVGVITMTNGNLTGTSGVLTGSAYNITGGTITAQLGGGTLIIGNGTTNIGSVGSNVGLSVNGSSAVANLTANVVAQSVTLNNGGSIIGSFSLNQTGGVTANSGSIASNLIGTGGVTINGTGNTLTLTGSNTYTGATTISAGNLSISSAAALGSTSGVNLANATALIYTGAAGNLTRNIAVTGGTGTIRNSGTGLLTLSGSLTKNGTTLTLTGGSDGIAVSGVISGSNANSDLVIDGGTTTLTNANNSYNGPTFIINSGTLNANTAGALPTSTLSALTINGSSTLALGASQSVASLSGTSGSSVNLNANTLTINASASTTYSGGISGTGNLVKNGSGTQTLAGATTFNGTTTVNSGTLQAAAAGAAGGTSQVVLNEGGSFLVTAGNAVNDSAAINLNGGRMAVSGNFDETVGLLTLSANSTIDFSGFAGTLRFGGIGSWATGATLAIWNWSGTTQYGTQVNNYQNPSNLVFTTTNSTLTSNLANISFYSDSGNSFVGSGFEVSGFSGGGSQIIAVPELETYLYAVVLLAGLVVQYIRRRAKRKLLKGQTAP